MGLLLAMVLTTRNCGNDLECFRQDLRTCQPKSTVTLPFGNDGHTGDYVFTIILARGLVCEVSVEVRTSQPDPANPSNSPAKPARYGFDIETLREGLRQASEGRASTIACVLPSGQKGTLLIPGVNTRTTSVSAVPSKPAQAACAKKPKVAAGCTLGDCVDGSRSLTCNRPHNKVASCALDATVETELDVGCVLQCVGGHLDIECH